MQAERPLSTHFAGRRSYQERMLTMRRTPMLRREFESSPSPLVCTTIVMDSNTATANRTKELELDEEGTRISLTIVDTPGFGDQIDNEAR